MLCGYAADRHLPLASHISCNAWEAIHPAFTADRFRRFLLTMLGRERGGELDVVPAMPGLDIFHDSAEHDRS